MRALIATDFQITEYKGRYYFGSSLSTIIKRYFHYFGKLVICTRIDNQPYNETLIDVTEMIDHIILCNSQMKVLLGQYNKVINKEIEKVDIVIARLPSFIGYCAADLAKKQSVKVLAESMGCAWDAYWNHGVAGKGIAPYMFLKMKAIVSKADYSIFVTNEFLQSRYPTSCPMLVASNVNLSLVDDLVLERRVDKLRNFDCKSITMMTTAAVDVRYKGQEYVIRAIPILNRIGIKVKYYLVGDGNQKYLKQLAIKLNVLDQVEFTGKKPLEDVFHMLETVDIYIQPSLQEGLPRSVIEAMSRGCACIGAKTAGIPELLPSEMVVKRKSYKMIADTIQWYCGLDLDKRVHISTTNFREARSYTNDVLNAKRKAFFTMIINDINSNENRKRTVIH